MSQAIGKSYKTLGDEIPESNTRNIILQNKKGEKDQNCMEENREKKLKNLSWWKKDYIFNSCNEKTNIKFINYKELCFLVIKFGRIEISYNVSGAEKL